MVDMTKMENGYAFRLGQAQSIIESLLDVFDDKRGILNHEFRIKRAREFVANEMAINKAIRQGFGWED